jgi:choline dehydrogenase
LTGGGPGASNWLHAGAFLKTRPELDRPDIQLHFVAAMMIKHGKVRPDRDAFTIHACQLRPESRGEVRLASADPLAPPLIDPRYLSSEIDTRTLRAAVRITRRIAEQGALAPFRGAEMRPGGNVSSDAEIDGWVRNTAETIYHPVGTCRMGVDDRSVVDDALRVRGVNALRVVDASVMPTITRANTNATAIMIGEKAADLISGRSLSTT